MKIVPDNKPTMAKYKRIGDASRWEDWFDKDNPDDPKLHDYYQKKFYDGSRKYLKGDEYFCGFKSNVHHEKLNGGILRGSVYLTIGRLSDPTYESVIRYGDHYNGDLPKNSGAFKIKRPLGKGAGRITLLQTKGDKFKSDPSKIVEVGRRYDHTEHQDEAKEYKRRVRERTKYTKELVGSNINTVNTHNTVSVHKTGGTKGNSPSPLPSNSSPGSLKH